MAIVNAAFSLFAQPLLERLLLLSHRCSNADATLMAGVNAVFSLFSGIIVFAYLIFHLADLTWGLTSDEWVRGHVYENMVHSMSRWWVALIYIFCNVLLSVHIYHGAWSMFQSLGINNPRYNSARRGLATLIAVTLLIGNLSFPIMVQAGVIDDGGDSVVEEMEAEGGGTDHPENEEADG